MPIVARSMSAAVPSSNGCATAAGCWIHSGPCLDGALGASLGSRSPGRERQRIDQRRQKWAADVRLSRPPALQQGVEHTPAGRVPEVEETREKPTLLVLRWRVKTLADTMHEARADVGLSAW